MNYLAAFLLLTLQLADSEGVATTGATAVPSTVGASQSSEENYAPAHPNIEATNSSSNPASKGNGKPPPEQQQQTPGTDNADCFHLGTGHVTASGVEADAFWLLNSLLSRFEGYFRDGFPTLLRDTELLGALLKNERGHCQSSSNEGSCHSKKQSASSSSLPSQPSLASHLEVCGFDLLMYTPKWLICMFLNTLPGHVAVRVWDLALWHGGTSAPSTPSVLSNAGENVPPCHGHLKGDADSAGTGNEATNEPSQVTAAAEEEETRAVRMDGGHGVLLWATLGVLRGLAPGLRQRHDFESVDACLKEGLDEKVRSFGWLQRHCGTSVRQVVADVRLQCAYHRANGCFKVPPPTAAAAGATAPMGLQDTSFRARAAATGNSGSSSQEKQQAWYLQCASERALVIGLAAAKSTAGELRLADDQRLQGNNISGGSGSMSTPEGHASVSSLVNDLGLGEDPLPDALRLLLAAHPLPDAVSVSVGVDSGTEYKSRPSHNRGDPCVLRPAGAEEGAAAMALLRTFALAYANQQGRRASRKASGANNNKQVMCAIRRRYCVQSDIKVCISVSADAPNTFNLLFSTHMYSALLPR